MKLKILTLAVLTALIGTGASAAVSPEFAAPKSFLNAFALGLGGGKGGYEFGFVIGDIERTQAITTDDLTFELRPNVFEYTNAVAQVGDTNAAATNAVATWTDSPDGGITAGPNGNRWTELLTFYEIGSIPNGTTNVTFTFSTGTDNLDAALYKQLTLEPKGFLKVFTEGFGGTYYEERAVLVSGNQVTLTYDVPVAAWGLPLQCGYIIEGINANADTYGGITVTTDDLIITSGDGTPPAPAPDFINGTPTALSDSVIYMECNESTDLSGVEYMFRNVGLGYDSGWQAETNWTDNGPLGPITTNDVEALPNTDFSTLEPIWEGWDTGDVGSETFVTVNAGVATVTPAFAGERSFYTSFITDSENGLAPSQEYQFSFSSDNVTVNGSESGFFVKEFIGGWNETIITKTPFTGGGVTQSFTFTTAAESFAYQVGWYTIGATTGSYDVQNPSLLAIDIALPGAPQGLDPATEYDYQVRARDLSTLTNDTGWSAVSSESTLAGDVTAPSPDPMEFVTGGDDASSQSVLMTAVTATDASAVEYFFEAVSGGGVDSGWQDSPIYVDTGLAASSTFEYRVKARDLSAALNETAYSFTNVSITTLSFPLSVSLTNDLKGFTPGTSNEDETVHSVLKADLQFADYANLDSRVAFDAAGATFGSFAGGDNGRNILKTLANNYAANDFEAYITSSFTDGAQNIFIGFGPGDLGAFGVPDWAPSGQTTNASFIVQVLTNAVEVWSQEANFGGDDYSTTTNAVVALNIGDDQRIKLDYDSGAGTCIVSVDTSYDGVTFTPDVVLGPVATPVFTGTSTIYLGGDDNVVLCDFEIIGSAAPITGVTDLVITPALELQWTGQSGQLYDVTYKNALTDGSWTVDTANDNISGVDGAMSATPAIAGDEVFYQVIAK